MKEGLVDASLSASAICRTWLPGDVFFWIFETISASSFLPSSAIDFLSCGFCHREVLNTVVVVAAVARHLAFAQRPFFLWLCV